MSARLWIVSSFFVLASATWAHSAEETRAVQLEDLKLTVPAAWKQQQPSNNLRLGQFEIPAAEGDKEPAELTIFNFDAGGGVKANLDRWVDQFLPAERQVKTTQGKCPQGEYFLVNISGTYKKPVGPPRLNKTEPMPAARMLGVILSMEKKGLYFLKLTGPDKTVAAAATGLRIALASKEQDEKPYVAE
jgi:gluconolactonase